MFGTAQKMQFSNKDFFIKCDQIRSFLRIWSHLLKKSLIKYFIFCAMWGDPDSFFILISRNLFYRFFNIVDFWWWNVYNVWQTDKNKNNYGQLNYSLPCG